MKLISFYSDGRPRVGMLDPAGVVVRPVLFAADGTPPRSMTEVVRRCAAAGLDAIVAGDEAVPGRDLELLAPIPEPSRNIFCVGKNYRDHSEEFSRSGYDATDAADGHDDGHPIFFTKPPSTVVGPGAAIEAHLGVTSALDYEAEIGVVIGPGGRANERADAGRHVWGYTLLNDVTARDLQHRHRQWFLGKSLDTFCPMGPWLVTADEIGAATISVECRVNGELRQRADTADLVFDIPTLISTLSAGMALQPGDIIATGTPAGVGIGFRPPRFLSPGDRIEISSPQLGQLVNHVEARTSPAATDPMTTVST